MKKLPSFSLGHAGIPIGRESQTLDDLREGHRREAIAKQFRQWDLKILTRLKFPGEPDKMQILNAVIKAKVARNEN